MNKPLDVALLALLVVVVMMPAQGAHAYWGGWDGDYYGTYGQGWKHYVYGGSLSIWTIGCNAGFVDASTNQPYDCAGHSWNYCQGYQQGFTAGQDQSQTDNQPS